MSRVLRTKCNRSGHERSEQITIRFAVYWFTHIRLHSRARKELQYPQNFNEVKILILFERKSKYLTSYLLFNHFRSHTTSECSTKSLLSNADAESNAWGSQSIFVIIMALIFALFLLTLTTLVFIKKVNEWFTSENCWICWWNS